jgi:hypothetical protein
VPPKPKNPDFPAAVEGGAFCPMMESEANPHNNLPTCSALRIKWIPLK